MPPEVFITHAYFDTRSEARAFRKRNQGKRRLCGNRLRRYLLDITLPEKHPGAKPRKWSVSVWGS